MRVSAVFPNIWHAVAFAGGLAKGGARPVVAIYSTFLQRGYDQIFHEVVLQDLPVVFAMDRSGLVGQDGPSHQGLYDISYIRTFPFTVLCAPRNGAELQSMLDLGLSQEHPFFIRYPRGDFEEVEALSEPVQLGKGEVIRDGNDVTLVGLGPMADIAVKAARQLAEHGVSAAVVNPRFVKPLDLELLLDFAGKTGFLVTIEEHQLMGGFGSAVLEAFAQAGKYADRVMPIGVPDRLIEHADRGECLEDAGLTSDHVVRAVLAQRSECSVEQ